MSEAPPRSAELIRLSGVEVIAGGRAIVAVPELVICPGETLAIVGPTGAGKSTLLEVLAGLERPARGEVHWRGQRLSHPWPLATRRRVALAFQQPLLFRSTVFDNVAYGLRVRGIDEREVAERAGAILRLFGIEALAGRAAHTLSGGEAQRTSLARAVVSRPDLLLLDEPLGSLDTPTRERLRAELGGIVRELGLACVHVTHDQAEAACVGDRVGVMIDGRLHEVAPPADVFERPRSEPVARFVGLRNLWRGEVVAPAPAARQVVELAGGQRVEAEGALPMGTTVLVSVRPEDLRIRPSDVPGDEDSDYTWGGTVESVCEAGSVSEILVDCGVTVLVRRLKRAARASRGAASELAPGQSVTVSFDRAAVYLVTELLRTNPE